ncbi:MAG: hypothetical protein QOD16_02490, partial [Nitrososphaeraceae archaeon]|nr:hypothetical protein [Nitrososphaeraceae archaeon]
MAQAQKEVKQNVTLSDILVGDSYLNFINSLKTESTKECYKNALLRFMRFFDIKDTQTLATLSPSEFEFYIKKYLEYQKQNNSSYNSMSMITNTVNHFCTMNDIVINSRKIAKFKTPTGNGKGKGQEEDEAYSREEIQKLFNVAPLRMKVCILVFASTGIRKGALASIQLRHMEKVAYAENNVYKITVYPGTRDQYIGFTTPECSKTIDEYFEYRTRLGEVLNPDSYLIREDFDITDIEQIRLKSRRISDRTISSGFYALAIKAGTRQRTPDKFTRKRVALLYGFRKFFTTELINSKLDPQKRELLLGHKIGLTGAYYRPTE